MSTEDLLEIELLDGGTGAKGVITNFTSAEISLDLMAPSEVSFELGDDGTWQSGADAVAPGARYQVRLNGRRLLTGRVESSDAPVDAPAGAVVRFTIRTKLSDAMIASADQKIAVKKTTLKEFLLAVYAPLGYTSDDFVFNADLGRDLRTGARSPGRGKSTELRIAKLTVEEARVSPPEPIFGAADRHLRRFGLMHWDGPDDTIIVGFPDQGMPPLYDFRALRGPGSEENNVLAATRSLDYSSLPSSVHVYGTSAAKRDFARSRIHGDAVDVDATAAGFNRPVNILAEQMLNDEAATNSAWRELSMRRGNKDKLLVEVDGLSYRGKGGRTNYAADTMAAYASDVAGGSLGRYYVMRAVMRRDASKGDCTHLTMLRQGLLALFPDAFEGSLTARPTAANYLLGAPPEAATVSRHK